MTLRVLDLFSCIGNHAEGFLRVTGYNVIQFCENKPYRQAVIAKRFPGIPIHGDVTTLVPEAGSADLVVGGPPCQKTSVAAAIHGKRTGESLWAEMLFLGVDVGVEWFVLEQPPGNSKWEAEAAEDLRGYGYSSARVEFAASDVGAPYLRRRVYVLACTSMSRLEVAWKQIPRAIDEVSRTADARGTWNPDKLGTLRVSSRDSGEHVRRLSSKRKERIEALGDSNPAEMMQVIALAISRAI